MNILLYNPDNQMTRNYLPHLWMFVLKALTPRQHQVFLIDGNAQPLSEQEMAQFIREKEIQLVGIGAMTRMAASAYRMADAIRAAGALVVMGGPHVSEVPDEPIGREEEPRHADAVALGEVDDIWADIVRDAERGQLREVYRHTDESGKDMALAGELPGDPLGRDRSEAVRPAREGPGLGKTPPETGRHGLE